MRTMQTTGVGVLVAVLGAGSAWAQEDGASGAEPPADTTEPGSAIDSGTGAALTGDPTADAASITGFDEGTSPKEAAGQTYLFVGAQYKAVVVPQFLMSMFGADGGTNVMVHGVGPEFLIRKDNFEYGLNLWYADYSMKPTPFKAKSDPPEAWEHVESQMSVVYLGADFRWTVPFSPVVGFNYGLGAGIGFPFGDLIRTEVAPPGGDRSIPVEQWSPCTGPGAPDANFCEEGPKNEPTWSDGGSKPVVFPWLVFQLGLRIKPHRNFAMRLDLVGFGTSGFVFGAGLDYGL
jgi:hypothetical protein